MAVFIKRLLWTFILFMPMLWGFIILYLSRGVEMEVSLPLTFNHWAGILILIVVLVAIVEKRCYLRATHREEASNV